MPVIRETRRYTEIPEAHGNSGSVRRFTLLISSLTTITTPVPVPTSPTCAMENFIANSILNDYISIAATVDINRSHSDSIMTKMDTISHAANI